MSIGIHADEDFLNVVDELEEVTIVRSGSDSVVLLARRITHSDIVSESGEAGVISSQITWDVPWVAGESGPRLGDIIRSASGDCGTVYHIESLEPGRRFRCSARNLSIGDEHREVVEVQEAVWQDLGSGLEITEWRSIRSVVNARLQSTGVTIDNDSIPPSSESTFLIILDVDFSLDHDHRIVGADGSVYRVDKVTVSRHGDTLSIVEGTLIPGS